MNASSLENIFQLLKSVLAILGAVFVLMGIFGAFDCDKEIPPWCNDVEYQGGTHPDCE